VAAVVTTLMCPGPVSTGETSFACVPLNVMGPNVTLGMHEMGITILSDAVAAAMNRAMRQSFIEL